MNIANLRTPQDDFLPYFLEVSAVEEKQRNATEDLIQSLEKVSARMIEAVLQTAQLAATASPEVQSLFHQWVSCLEEQILEELRGERKALDLEAWAGRIGVTPTSLASLLLSLQRKGSVRILRMEVEPGGGRNEDLCDCLR